MIALSLLISALPSYLPDGHFLPARVIRSDSPTCAAAIPLERGKLCLSRQQWEHWLALPDPGAIVVDPASLHWKPVRAPLLDRPAVETQVHLRARLAELRTVRPAGLHHRLWLRIVRAIERQRQEFSQAIARHDPSGWLRGWIIGERTGTGSAEVSFALGLVHILTTAGVHLLFVSRAIGFVLARIWPEPRHLGVLQAAVEFPLFGWIWGLSGWRWGMLRPLLLIAIGRVFRSRGISLRPWWVLAGLVALECTVWGFNPWAVHYLAATLGSWLWVLPLQVWHDHSVSLLTPVLSAISIPVVGGLLMPWALASIPFPALAPALGAFAQGCWEAWIRVARLPGSTWNLEPWVLLPVAWLALGRRLGPWMWAGVLGLALAFKAGTGCVGKHPWRILQLDVGQGDAALIVSEQGGVRSAGLIDIGSGRAAGAAAWLGVFTRQRIDRLDWVVLTHLDEDHWGGLRHVAPWIRIGCVVVPPPLWESAQALEIRELGRRWGFRVQPGAQGCFPHAYAWAQLRTAGARARANGVMAGVRVRLGQGLGGGVDYINLGDAPAALEEDLWRQLQKAGGIEQGRRILKLSHHGSRTSSSRGVLGAIFPDEVWISAGLSNPYRHPNPEVMGRIEALGLRWKGTWQEGVVTLKGQ